MLPSVFMKSHLKVPVVASTEPYHYYGNDFTDWPMIFTTITVPQKVASLVITD